MATRVGSLFVDLVAKTGPFKKGMQSAGLSVTKFAKTIARGAAGMAAFAGAMATGAAIGLSVLVKRAMANIDVQAKLAARIGVTTEALLGLQFAAELNGSSAEQLNAALDVLQKRLGQAAQGTGQAKRALGALGLTVEQLLGMNPADQFMLIAERIAMLPSVAMRAAVTSDLFSRANQKLVNTLALGADGLRELQKEAEKLGFAYSRVDAAKVEAANDAITRIKATISGIVNTIAINLAPYIETLGNMLAKVGSEGDGMAGKVNAAFKYINEVMRRVVKFAAGLPLVLQYAKLGFLDMGRAVLDWLKSVEQGLDGLPFVDLEESIGKIDKGLQKLDKEAQTTQVAVMAEALKQVPQAQSIDEWFDKLQKGADKAAESARNHASAVRDEADALNEANDAAKQLNGTAGVGRVALTAIGRAVNQGFQGRMHNGKQMVEDPRLRDTNRILEQIQRNTQTQTAVLA